MLINQYIAAWFHTILLRRLLSNGALDLTSAYVISIWPDWIYRLNIEVIAELPKFMSLAQRKADNMYCRLIASSTNCRDVLHAALVKQAQRQVLYVQ